MVGESREHLLPYGVLPDGRLAHVSEVPSGLACVCRCPECDGLLVARKGQVVVHHFAHHTGLDCPGGGWETALHRLCKEVIMGSRQIMLPAAVAEHSNLRRVVSKALMFDYDSSREEVRMDGLVPDIVVEVKGRSLLVEVLVTHACGPEKIALLRQRGLACVEIDMSAVARDLPRAEHERLILVTAPRNWLHNVRIEEAVAELRAIGKEQTRIWRERKDAANAERLFREWSREPKGCFAKSSTKWNASVVSFLRCMPSSRADIDDLLMYLVEECDLKPTFGFLDEDEWTDGLISLLEASCPGFVSPQSVVISWLRAMGASVRGKWVTLSRDAMDAIMDAQSLSQERSRRQHEVDGFVVALARSFPDKKNAVEAWALQPLGIAVTCIQGFPNDWLRFKEDMDAMLSMFLRGGPPVDQDRMRGLPLYEERLSLIERRKAQEDEARERQAQQHLKRVQSMLKSFNDMMGDEGILWACSRLKVEQVGLELAMQSLEHRALDDLASEFDRYAAPAIERARARCIREASERKQSDLHAFCTQMLLMEARAAFSRKPSQAEAWMAYPNKFLGGRRPSEFCKDHEALKECKRLLKNIAR